MYNITENERWRSVAEFESDILSFEPFGTVAHSSPVPSTNAIANANASVLDDAMVRLSRMLMSDYIRSHAEEEYGGMTLQSSILSSYTDCS